jgi:hypothetical protein
LNPDAPASPEAGNCGSGPLALLHWNVSAQSTVFALDFEFKVTNTTGKTIPLSSLVLHYYLTSEFTVNKLYTYYTEVCCSAPRPRFDANVTLALRDVSPAKPTATSYIEIGFDSAAGTLADQDTVKVEVGLVGNQETATQTNDYSYVASATGNQQQWDNCPHAPGGPMCAKYVSCVTTVYQDGVLSWGTPP